MKWIYAVVLLLAGLLFQTCLAFRFQIWGVSPDLLAVFLVLATVSFGRGTGALLGGIGGFVLDVLNLFPGYYTMAYLLLGAITGYFSSHTKYSPFLVSGCVLTGFVFIKQLIQYLIVFLMGGSIGVIGCIREILICTIYTTIIFACMYLLFSIRRLLHRFKKA